MDLETICQEISYIANDTTLASGGTNYSRCKAWVREVYYLDILAQRTDWWFLRDNDTKATVSGTEIVSLSSGTDIKQVREIRIAGYSPLNAWSESQADEFAGDNDITLQDRPTAFWHYDYDTTNDVHRIQLYPVPNDAYTLNIRMSSTPDTLTGDSDVPSLPSQFQYLLVKGGYTKALKHNQDPGFQQEFAEFQQQLRRLFSWNARDNYRTDTWWNP